MVACAAEVESGGLLQNGKIAIPPLITLNELVFSQPTAPTKTDNYAAEGIVTATIRQKKMDI